MNRKFARLLGALRAISSHHGDVQTALAAAPPVGALPAPQLSWTLLCLFQFWRRYRWAWRVLHERFWFNRGHQKLVLRDWEFEFDGPASSATHRGHKETILVDAWRGPDDLSYRAFGKWAASQREPGPTVQRLRELFPGGCGSTLALGVLRCVGLVQGIDDGRFVLCRGLRPFAAPAREFLAQWSEPTRRLGLAAAIGDWPAAHTAVQILGRSDLLTETGANVERTRILWLRHLRRYVASGRLDGDVLFALAYAQADDLAQYVDRALAEPTAVHAALRIVANDPSWCAQVFNLISSARAADDELDWACAEYLKRHGYRMAEVMDMLADRARP
jgi:hypothetical protein